MLKFLTILCAASIALIGCEESNFEGAVSATPEKPITEKPTEPIIKEPGVETQSFVAKPGPQQKSKVDVLFLMDTSGSMVEEKAAVETKLQEFIGKFDASLDYHVYVVAAEIGYAGLFQNYIPFDINLGALTESNNITKINVPVDSYNALKVFHDLIQNDSSELTLREEASLEVVVVSDDNPISLEQSNRILNSSSSNAVYKKLYTDGLIQFPMRSTELIEVLEESYSEKTIHFNGFIGKEDSARTDDCQVQRVGQDYIDLAQHEKFEGFIADICSDDWTSKFDDLADTIIAQNIAQKYSLKNTPSAESDLKLYINDVLIDAEKYTVQGVNIIFDQALEPQEGDQIRISYLAL